MGPRLQISVILISIFFVFFIFYMIKKETLELKYSLVWMFTGISLVIITINPRIIIIIANLLGIGLPVNALFLIGIIFILIILLVITVAVSKNSVKLKRITQELAILKMQMSNKSQENIK